MDPDPDAGIYECATCHTPLSTATAYFDRTHFAGQGLICCGDHRGPYRQPEPTRHKEVERGSVSPEG